MLYACLSRRAYSRQAQLSAGQAWAISIPRKRPQPRARQRFNRPCGKTSTLAGRFLYLVGKGCSSPPAAPNIKVELPSQARVRAGEPLEIRWKSEGHRDKGCRYPLYLVFTTRAHARFEGEWFLAFPAGGAGPFGISQAIDQTLGLYPFARPDRRTGTSTARSCRGNGCLTQFSQPDDRDLTNWGR